MTPSRFDAIFPCTARRLFTTWVGWSFAAVFVAVLSAAPVRAQSALDGFNPRFSNTVTSLLVQPDGKVLVRGFFTQVGGQPRDQLARLNPDGTVDAGFAPDVDGRVDSVALQSDDKVLIGGRFTQVNGQPRMRLARLNADGTLDDAFDLGANAHVQSLVRLQDNKILISGDFTQIGGQERQFLARLNADGTLDNGFDTHGSISGFVRDAASLPDGRILIGGQFTAVGGYANRNIARLNADGTLDGSFSRTANDGVYALALLPDGKVMLGGQFTQIDGQPHAHLARLNVDGTLDAGFNHDADSIVDSIAFHPDGRVWVGGAFTQVSGQARRYLARFNADGTLDASFDPPVVSQIRALAVQADGKVLAGGSFQHVNFAPYLYLARLHADGTLDTDLNPGADRLVYSLVPQPDGKLLAVGNFTQMGGQPRNRIARLHADGRLDIDFTPDANDLVGNTIVQPDGTLLLGGRFTQVDGQPRNRIARLHADGTLDASFHPDADGEVFCLAVQPDGKLLVGGVFTQMGGQQRPYIARLHADGSLDTGFNPDLDRAVFSIILQPDGKVLVGGNFTQVSGQTRYSIARLNADGTLDVDFSPYVIGFVSTLALQPDGKVLLGGEFSEVNGLPLYHIARLNADGTLDTGFRPISNGIISSFILQADGKLVVGGVFTSISGYTRLNIARLNADGTLDAGFNPGANGEVLSVAVQADGKVLLGGVFTQVGGQPRSYLARVSAPEVVLQSLDVSPDRASLIWLRSGSGQDLSRVYFEHSDDGVAWSPLGAAERIAGGWSLGGLDLPRNQHVWLRVRGFGGGGYLNGSMSLLESVRQVYLANHTVTAAVQAGQGQVTPASRNVDPGQDAAFTVTPDAGWRVDAVSGDTCTPVQGSATYWTAANIEADCAVSVTFAPMLPPSAAAQSVSVPYNTSQAITISGSDPNSGGPFTLSYAIATPPAQGAISAFDAATGALTYTPTLTYSGSDSFTFTVETVNGTSAAATVSLTIAEGQAVQATAQSVSVPYNTAQPITLGGSDPNPGGPFTLNYAIATPPAQGALSGFDPATGTLTYTPAFGHSGSDSFTFTVESVNGTSLPAEVSLSMPKPQLALAIDRDRDYARYGRMVDYLVTLTNNGPAASAVPVEFSLSAGFDGDHAQLSCIGAGAGATCEQGTIDPLRYTVTVPSGRGLTWAVSVPVRMDAADESVELAVSAIGAGMVTDTRTLVLLRDGFDRSSGDGTQSPAVIDGAAAKAVLEGDALQEIEVPTGLSATTTPLLIVRDGGREVRVEYRTLDDAVLVRLIERTADGSERTTPWSRTNVGVVLVLGSVGADDASGIPSQRAIVLSGGDVPLALH